jgi:hypothetical protein
MGGRYLPRYGSSQRSYQVDVNRGAAGRALGRMRRRERSLPPRRWKRTLRRLGRHALAPGRRGRGRVPGPQRRRGDHHGFALMHRIGLLWLRPRRPCGFSPSAAIARAAWQCWRRCGASSRVSRMVAARLASRIACTLNTHTSMGSVGGWYSLAPGEAGSNFRLILISE